MFTLCASCLASPLASITPGTVSVSASAHSIHWGADAHSQIYELDYGINTHLAATTEVSHIVDAEGSATITSIYLRTPIILRRQPKLSLAGYGGITKLSVTDNFDDTSSSTGITIGSVADYQLGQYVDLYGRAGVAFLEKPLWTFDAGIRYEVVPRWYLSIGYRGYNAAGSSFGGTLVGATYRFSL